MATCFVDSTTLLYPLDETQRLKASRCEAWLNRLRDTDALTMSPQVLNECYSVARRKPHFAAARPTLREYLLLHVRWVTAPLGPSGIAEAWAIEDRYGVGFWDALLLAAANAAGCSRFLSEDLNDGQAYGGVVAVNPFRHRPEDVLGPAPQIQPPGPQWP